MWEKGKNYKKLNCWSAVSIINTTVCLTESILYAKSPEIWKQEGNISYHPSMGVLILITGQSKNFLGEKELDAAFHGNQQ